MQNYFFLLHLESKMMVFILFEARKRSVTRYVGSLRDVRNVGPTKMFSTWVQFFFFFFVAICAK